ncbi:dephospho-CoA kinase [Fulvivirga ligni]|uniref:dephospho-CoA kinase n=1 Tax=Fulvivirga ligni TaxID=2904246 RepID=UPI001EEB64B1|nr:dephospho-CoA kinase [Fulvivirga ligni]UII22391.1 dephospho-CoA kinase [Fulvivirga ligni]
MSNLPLQVGVTGGIGSGKSMVCEVFASIGAPTYDADKRGKWLTDNHAEIVEEVSSLFGEDAYKNGQLDRPFIAKIVFNAPEKLQQLNQIIHPRVKDDYLEWVSYQDYPYVIKEAAIMFESGSNKSLDKVITVYAAEDIRIKRVQQRDPFRSVNEIKTIIKKQLPEEERQALSDYVIVNDDSELLLPQVLKLHYQFANDYSAD